MSFKRQLAGWLRRFRLLRWLLALAVRLFVPRHYVGAVGVIFNEAGQVLVMEHVFRPHFPWGLPGGWVERGEDPAETVRREVEEELALRIEVKKLVLCMRQGGFLPKNTTPPGLGLVYYCRPLDDSQTVARALAQATQNHEILSIEWVDPVTMPYKLSSLEQNGVLLARQVFEMETSQSKAS
ncbi:MAG: NUDIX hydrolase [Anaerolineales bacterium]|nr:NUDIX hydrolase [Anaerolineales bacterium]